MRDATMDNVSDPVFHFAEQRPDARALIEGGTTLTYRALAGFVARAVAYLDELGVAPGDRVALSMPNSIDHIILVLALFRLGAVLIEVPSMSWPAYRAELMRKFNVKLALLDATAEALPTDAATVRIPLAWRTQLPEIEVAPRAAGGDATCAIVLSSGSTGSPKGTVVSHARLLRYIGDESLTSLILSVDRPCPVLIPLSISYGGFFGWALSALLVGSPLVLLPKIAVASDLMRAVASWGDAILPATPEVCRLLATHAPPGELLLPQLRALVSMGQPLFANDKKQLVERVTPRLYDGYGAVAVGYVAYLSPEDMLTKGHTVGRPMPGVEVEIVDETGRPVPPGAVGKLRARRPGHVPVHDGEPTPQGADAEWFFPGEFARFDEDGYLEIKGRTADTVTRRGVSIFVPEIEEALTAHPQVRDAAVIALVGPAASEPELVAFVVKSGPVEHEALARHCTDLLTADKLPNRLFYMDALPLLGTGKVDRHRLKELAQGQR
jgi:acyl-coenzyme A synthetase/AMP-(fatty) acid ligase